MTDPAAWLEENLPLVQRLSRFVCRGSRVTDVDDFVSHVSLKLVDNDYAVLRKFEGRCTVASFLIVVIRRALSDYVAHLHGKFRASAEALRMGDEAVELEVLVRRDGKSLDEAARTMKLARADAERIVARLPERSARAVEVELDAAAGVTVSQEVGGDERASTSRVVSASLRDAIGELPADDQAILRLHFVAGWSIADIARSLQLEQQRLYPRIRRICKSLRERLVAAGVDAERIGAIIGRTDVDLDFGLDAENESTRTSSQ